MASINNDNSENLINDNTNDQQDTSSNDESGIDNTETDKKDDDDLISDSADGDSEEADTYYCHDQNYDELDPFPADDPGTVSGIDPAAAKKGKAPKDNKLVNIRAIEQRLSQKGIKVRYNEITKVIEIFGMPTIYSEENAANTINTVIADEFRTEGKKVTDKAVENAIKVIADKNRYNPVKKKLDSTIYNGKDYLQIIFKILRIEGDEFSQMLVRKWLHQCIALALNDPHNPISADGVLTLHGGQGAAKTLFFRILVPDPDLFGEGISINVESKDSKIQATTVWIAEIGELDSTLKRKQAQLKAFLTCPRDTYRIPYDRSAIRPVRRTSFCATVNPDTFLNDDTGSRRFYVVHVDMIDKITLLSLTKDDIWQLWRQIYEQYYLPDPQGFRLTDEEREALESRNSNFETAMPGEIELMDQLDFLRPYSDWKYYTISDLQKRFNLYTVSTASQLGKVLAKIAREKPEVLTKNISGTKMYFLP